MGSKHLRASASEKLPGVLCLESDWDWDNPTDRSTIEPALELLEKLGYLRLHHRNVNSSHEFFLHLDRWIFSRAYRDFRLLYLGFHGSSDTVNVGQDEVGLDEVRRRLADSCVDSVLFFASCGVLSGDADVLMKLCKHTGASAIVGYSEDVDFVEAAAFELLLFPRMLDMTGPKRLYNAMVKDYPDLSRRLGFTVATSKWVSGRA